MGAVSSHPHPSPTTSLTKRTLALMPLENECLALQLKSTPAVIPHHIYDHMSLDPDCPWRGECLNVMAGALNSLTLTHKGTSHAPPQATKPQRPWSSLPTPAVIPPLHLQPLELWPLLHLERIPQSCIRDFQRLISTKTRRKSDHLSHRLHLYQLEKERPPKEQAPPTSLGGKDG